MRPAASRGATVVPSLRLGALGDHGGPVPTLVPAADSPLVDAVAPDVCPPPATDARGIARPQGAGCDAGAVERTTTDPDGPVVDPDQPPPPGALSVDWIGSPSELERGAPGTWITHVTNAGDQATAVQLTVTPPNDVIVNGWTVDAGGSCTWMSLIPELACSWPSLPAGAVGTVTTSGGSSWDGPCAGLTWQARAIAATSGATADASWTTTPPPPCYGATIWVASTMDGQSGRAAQRPRQGGDHGRHAPRPGARDAATGHHHPGSLRTPPRTARRPVGATWTSPAPNRSRSRAWAPT